jgi:pSer/pThr/pTyr-binding forkhead associated (FHA) protein
MWQRGAIQWGEQVAMQVKLKVLVGKSAGKEITVPVSRFLIGRSKDCHMRPKSDSISRNHCAILTKGDQVVVRDLNSRNGTLVNGNKLDGDCAVKNGDKVKVGKLEFEMLITGVPAKEAKKPVKEPAEAAPKLSNPDTGSIDFDVSDWLEEADAVEQARRSAEPDTRQFQMDETDRIQLEQEEGQAAADSEEKPHGRPEQKTPGKLPQRPSQQAATSRDAAAEMLKKFFNNR